MSTCGNCGSSSESSTERKFFIAEVEEAVADTCKESSPCEFNTPFYDETIANSSFNIAEVGGIFTISVCDNNRWAVGQWVFIPNAGKFEITGKDSCSTLYLRNGCGSGETATAIPGNASPGKNFSGTQKVWPTTDPGCGDSPTDDYCTQVLTSIRDCDTLLCKYLDNIDDEGEYVLPAVSYEGDEFFSCFYKAPSIKVKPSTLCFPLIPSTSLSSVGDDPVQDVVWHPAEGCLNKRALPQKAAIDIYCEGEKKYLQVPDDWEDSIYKLGVDDDGCVAFIKESDGLCNAGTTRHVKTYQQIHETLNKSFSSANYQTVNFSSFIGTLPDCAPDVIGVEVLLHYSVSATTSSSAGGELEVTQDGIDMRLSRGSGGTNSHFDGTSVILKVSKDSPTLQFRSDRITGSGGNWDLRIYGLALHY